MNAEPRPRLSKRKGIALGVLACVALVFIYILNQWAPTPSWGGSMGADGRIVLDAESAVWYRTVLLSLFTSSLTISVYEFLNVFLQWGVWVRLERKTFDEFWGDEASDRCGDGLIVLQTDKIDVLLENYDPGIKKAIDSKWKCRLFKARDWMNYFDADGATKLIKEFRDLGLDAPLIVPIRRGTDAAEITPPATPPFTLTMGLGFSEKTDDLIQSVCSKWMKTTCSNEYGEVLELHHSLVPDELSALKSAPGENMFVRILPKDWQLSTWLHGDRSSRDYAMVMRHTELDGERRHMKFVLAGFTERGTAAAAEFLAKNWKELWKKRLKGNDARDSRGDFMIVIEGPSHYRNIAEWRMDKSLGMITPERLAEVAPHLECPWGERCRR